MEFLKKKPSYGQVRVKSKVYIRGEKERENDYSHNLNLSKAIGLDLCLEREKCASVEGLNYYGPDVARIAIFDTSPFKAI